MNIFHGRFCFPKSLLLSLEIMNLYLIRHAETAVPDGYVQKNFSLSELGQTQSHALAQRMSSIRIDRLFCSPLARARQTAEYISKSRSIPIEIETDFREMDLGEIGGMPLKKVYALHGDYLRSRPHPVMEYGYVQGETAEAFHSRVAVAFEKMVWKPFCQRDVNVVLVAHGGVICAILLHLLGLTFDGYLTYFVDYTGISKIDNRHARPRIRYINDINHLKKADLI